jgi:hypothetical protein|tara:strand:+ start:618 stop:989 length:372 start_codon:yes stop_codon:yes gene_type:complete
MLAVIICISISCILVLLWVNDRIEKIYNFFRNSIFDKRNISSEDMDFRLESHKDAMWNMQSDLSRAKGVFIVIFIIALLLEGILTRDSRPNYEIDWVSILFFPVLIIGTIIWYFIKNKFQSRD